ncbi:MAG: class I SAM-dependent methyltransferase [Deltaproteobacteria bacterium]|nr:class I SAM-dependent methyltransferase [Deltaproteobacteria bacterium]MBW2530703.1 class I SAM-dependent methyltransferase [Deltaproteobacteria bacterium]
MARMGRSLAEVHRRTISVPRAERIAAALSQQIGQADSLLDVGCGDGRIARATARAVGATEVRGVDVKLQPRCAVDAMPYDGVALPYDDGRFEVVLLCDVLHHAAEPDRLLAECLRVARRAVALKDHLRFGPVSQLVLLAMDHVGNAAPGVAVRGHYLSLSEWVDRIERAGARIRTLRWPLRIHDLPWRLVARSEYQFSALLELPRGAGGAPGEGDHDR